MRRPQQGKTAGGRPVRATRLRVRKKTGRPREGTGPLYFPLLTPNQKFQVNEPFTLRGSPMTTLLREPAAKT